MLKGIVRASLVIVPLIAFSVPLSAEMIAGPKGAQSAKSGLVHQIQHRRRERERERPYACAKDAMSVAGKQRVTESMAKASADKAWQEKVRFAHGELYLDLANARDVRYRCSVSSPTLHLKRCELIAIPCRAPSSG